MDHAWTWGDVTQRGGATGVAQVAHRQRRSDRALHGAGRARGPRALGVRPRARRVRRIEPGRAGGDPRRPWRRPGGLGVVRHPDPDASAEGRSSSRVGRSRSSSIRSTRASGSWYCQRSASCSARGSGSSSESRCMWVPACSHPRRSGNSGAPSALTGTPTSSGCGCPGCRSRRPQAGIGTVRTVRPSMSAKSDGLLV